MQNVKEDIIGVLDSLDDAILVELQTAIEDTLIKRVAPSEKEAVDFYLLLKKRLKDRCTVEQVEGCLKMWKLVKSTHKKEFIKSFSKAKSSMKKLGITKIAFIAYLVSKSPILCREWSLRWVDIIQSLVEIDDVFNHNYGAYVGTDAMELLVEQIEVRYA